MSAATSFSSLAELQAKLSACCHCAERFGFTPAPMVWGTAAAPIVLIGQAPSKNVHVSGKPFNDASGKRLRRWLGISESIFWDQQKLYITAVGHCYPGKSPKPGGGDLKPPAICADLWLKNELPLVSPRLYLLVGALAAAYFFPKKKLHQLVFDTLTIEGIPALVLPHPSPLNQKWFKDHPEFENGLVPELQQLVKLTLSP